MVKYSFIFFKLFFLILFFKELHQLKQDNDEKCQILQNKSINRVDIGKNLKKKKEEKKIIQDKSRKSFHDNHFQEYKQDPKPLFYYNLKEEDDNLLENINDRTGLFDKKKDQNSFLVEESQRLNLQKHKNPEENKHDNEHTNLSKLLKRRHSTSLINKTHRDFSVNETQNKKSTCNLKDQEQFTFTPKLSKKSLIMAKKLGKSRDRLTRDSLLQVYKKREKLKENIENEYSFKPKINKNSENLISRKNDYDQKPKWEILHEHVKN